MLFFARSTTYVAVFCCVFFSAVGHLWAEDEGQEDLNLATETKLATENKLSAESLSDLGEVIRLCESAMKKGLDEDNTKFATHLLVGTLVQRADFASQMIFRSGPVNPRWNDLRRLALADLEKAVKLVPEEPEALVLIAKLNFLPRGNKARAIEALDKAIAIKGGSKDLRAAALVMRAATIKDPKKRFADLKEALRIAPHLAPALRARGFHYATLNKSQEALDDLEAAEKIEPNHPATVKALAIILTQMKKYDQAIKKLDQLAKMQPKLVAPLIIKARIHAARSDNEEAMKCLDQALKLQPGNLEVLLLRAGLYDAMKQPEKALAAIARVLELKPDHDSARHFRAILLARAGKIDEIMAELKKILKDSPDDVPVQLQMAVLYVIEDKQRKAIDVYSNILAKHPKNTDALVGRASSYLTIGNHGKSIADYNKASRLGAENSGMLNNFAWVLATTPMDKLRDGKRAVELATKACELTDYKQAHIISTLAAAYAETGNFKEAVKWSKKSVELSKDGDDKEIQEALAKELECFKKGEPWREKLLENDKKDDKPSKPEATEPEPKTSEKPEPEEKSAK